MKKAIEIFREDLNELYTTTIVLDLYKRLSIYSKNNSHEEAERHESNATFFNNVDLFENQNYVFNYLFIQSITILETYLNLRLLEEIRKKPDVSNQIITEYSIGRKLTSQDVIKGPIKLAREIIESIIYHNFAKVNILYKIAFNFSILDFIPKDLWLDVKLRHKLVHRSGIIKDKKIFITPTDFHFTLQNVSDWVENIEYFIKNGRQRKNFPSLSGRLNKTYTEIRKSDIYKSTYKDVMLKMYEDL